MEDTKSFKVKEDVHQSPEYGKYMEKIGWITYKIEDPKNRIQIFIKKVWPGAIAKIQRVDLPIPWEAIHKILKKHRVFMCKIEPMNSDLRIMNSDLRKLGFRLDGWPLLGTKTLRVDLSPGEEVILNSFKKDARYCIRKCSELIVQSSLNEYEKFYEIWKSSARRKNLWIPSKKDYLSLVECFGEKAFCVTANDLAGCLVLTHKNTAFYFYSGAVKEAKNNQLPYGVVWEAMKEAKKRGCETWDFEGIYDSRWPNKGWLGFSHFKKSFGGEEIEFPGCFSRWSWVDLIG